MKDTKLCKSPVALKGLEIILSMTFSIEASKLKVLERLQDHIKNYYTTEKQGSSNSCDNAIDLTTEDSQEVLAVENDEDEGLIVECEEILTDTAIVVESD